MTLVFPRRSRGRQTAVQEARFQEELAAFCAEIVKIDSRLDFKVSARGWGYICENRGVITKDELDACEKRINDCRKSGALPLDICAVDDTRAFDNVEEIDDDTPEEKAQAILDGFAVAHEFYMPTSFWENQDCYVQTVVEKIDLKSLFTSECAVFRVPIAASKGWNDISMRAAMMRRFAYWESKGKQCVLLNCHDHDPAGLNISGFLRSNMADVSGAIGGWSPDNVIIDRFGLNFDFIEANHLTWIDNLITGSGEDLANPKHHDHHKEYVQSYIERFGAHFQCF